MSAQKHRICPLLWWKQAAAIALALILLAVCVLCGLVMHQSREVTLTTVGEP